MTVVTWIALAGLVVSLLGMGARLVMFMHEIKLELRRIRAERRVVQSVPFLALQVQMLAKHVGFELPPMPRLGAEEEGDAE